MIFNQFASKEQYLDCKLKELETFAQSVKITKKGAYQIYRKVNIDLEPIGSKRKL